MIQNSSASTDELAERPKIENPEFFNLLESRGIIDRGFINDLLDEFDNNALDVLSTLIQSGIDSKVSLCQLWCDSIGIAHVDLQRSLFQPDVVRKVPERIARLYYAIPVYQMGDTVTVATATPENKKIAKILEDITGGPVSLVFALPQDIEASIEKEYAACSSVFEFFKKLSAADLLRTQTEITTRVLTQAGGNDALNQFHIAVILYGVTRSASEIAISSGKIKARVDIKVPRGENLYLNLEKSIYDHLVTRLSSLAGVAQNATASRYGHILIPTPGKKIDLVMESHPEENGPRIILRMTREKSFFKIPPVLDSLYLSHHITRAIKKDLRRTKGHILICGPAKSGKSTLAYAMLGERAGFFRKNMSMEQGIKFFLSGIDQYQVSPQAGGTTMNLLESGLHQKYETLYVQNVAEPEIPATISNAVLSGQFIIAGIGAENTGDALEKIIHLNGGSTLTAIISQQLVARLCDICKVKYPLQDDHVQMMFETDSNKTLHAWRGNGCPYCNDTGFSGLIGIHEILMIDNTVRKMIIDKESPKVIRNSVKSENLYTMHYDGVKKVLRGLTTFDEIHRLQLS